MTGSRLGDVGVPGGVRDAREGLNDALLHALALQEVSLDEPQHVGRIHRRPARPLLIPQIPSTFYRCICASLKHEKTGISSLFLSRQ